MVGSGKLSFSNLKLIKTYAYSSNLGDERLSALVILLIENDIAENLNWVTLLSLQN